MHLRQTPAPSFVHYSISLPPTDAFKSRRRFPRRRVCGLRNSLPDELVMGTKLRIPEAGRYEAIKERTMPAFWSRCELSRLPARGAIPTDVLGSALAEVASSLGYLSRWFEQRQCNRARCRWLTETVSRTRIDVLRACPDDAGNGESRTVKAAGIAGKTPISSRCVGLLKRDDDPRCRLR